MDKPHIRRVQPNPTLGPDGWVWECKRAGAGYASTGYGADPAIAYRAWKYWTDGPGFWNVQLGQSVKMRD